MGEEVGIKNERVDDIPLLRAQMERMGIQPCWIAVSPRTETWKRLNHVGMPVATQVLPRNSADDRCGEW